MYVCSGEYWPNGQTETTLNSEIINLIIYTRSNNYRIVRDVYKY